MMEIKRNPTALLSSNIWEKYQEFKADRAKMSVYVKGELNQHFQEDRLIPKELLKNEDLSHGHMSTKVEKGPGGGNNGTGNA